MRTQVILKSQMLHYFIVIFKKRNNNLQSMFFFSGEKLVDINIRRYIYIYNWYLLQKLTNFPFYIYNNFFFREDYFLLGLLDYTAKTSSTAFQQGRKFIYKLKSNFFIKPIVKVFSYQNFNVRIHWFGYFSLGKYVEYFRYFKYLEYLKRIPNHISYGVKNMLRGRYVPDIALLFKHKLALMQHNYIFFDDRCRKEVDANIYNFLSIAFTFVNSLSKKLYMSLVFWCTAVFYKFFMSIFSHFNNFSFIWFTHRVWFCFKHRLPEYAKFRSLLPRFWFSSLKNLKFTFSKWFFRYFVKKIYLAINTVNFVEFKSIPWFYTLDLVLFDIAHRVHYHRTLIQLDKDAIKNCPFFF